jgi:DNA-binding Lrp family transcriptional regulator
MDMIDKKLLNRLQRNLPVDPHPYALIGAELGLTEQEVLQRIESFMHQGLIRRIGASVAPKRTGNVSTLVAVAVDPLQLQDVVNQVNLYDEVTHNYGRDHRFNLWFTLIAPSQLRITTITTALRALPGVQELLELPATDLFKISVYFDFCLLEEEP